MKKDLLRNIQDDLKEEYVKNLVDKHTNLIIIETLDDLDHLSHTYGKIHSNKVIDKY